jgi:hypothetical protein
MLRSAPSRCGAGRHEHRACEQGLRPTEQINRCYFRAVYFSGVRRILFELVADDAGFGVDEASRTETEAARQSAAMSARRCKFFTREAGRSFLLHAPRDKARYGSATRPS